MKKYAVEVVRVSYSILEIEVEAKSRKEAKARAIEDSDGLHFSDEVDAEGKVGSVTEKK